MVPLRGGLSLLSIILSHVVLFLTVFVSTSMGLLVWKIKLFRPQMLYRTGTVFLVLTIESLSRIVNGYLHATVEDTFVCSVGIVGLLLIRCSSHYLVAPMALSKTAYSVLIMTDVLRAFLSVVLISLMWCESMTQLLAILLLDW